MKNLASIDIYENVALIVEVTDICNKNCPGNYNCRQARHKDGLREEIYKNYLNKLKRNSLIALRGGEPTMIDGWFEKFIEPAVAINKNLLIIIETNGYFIGQDDYDEILKKLCHQNIFIRISFDSRHIFGLNEEDCSNEFSKMASFAEEALVRGINFGFYSLGMAKDQIWEFIKGTPLEPYFQYFHTLIKYDDISKVVLRGKYLRAGGKIFNCIKND